MCHYLASVLFLAVAQLLWPALVMLLLAPCSGPHHGRERDTCRDPCSRLDTDAGTCVQGAEMLVERQWGRERLCWAPSPNYLGLTVPSGYYFKAVDSTTLEAWRTLLWEHSSVHPPCSVLKSFKTFSAPLNLPISTDWCSGPSLQSPTWLRGSAAFLSMPAKCLQEALAAQKGRGQASLLCKGVWEDWLWMKSPLGQQNNVTWRCMLLTLFVLLCGRSVHIFSMYWYFRLQFWLTLEWKLVSLPCQWRSAEKLITG